MRTEIREGFDALLAAWRRYDERCGWLYDNREHPEWAAFDEKARRTGVKMGELRDHLATLCHVEAPDILALMLRVDGDGDSDVRSPAAGGEGNL